MEATFQLQIVEDSLIKKLKRKAVQELNQFYERDWKPNSIRLFMLPDRKTLDLLRGGSSESWVVGFCFSSNSIAMMTENAINNSSMHTYSDGFYYKLLKHEISHIYFEATYGQSYFTWINEGMAVCVAEQYNKTKQLNGFLNGKNVYMEAGYLFSLLMNNFGKETVVEFLKAQSGVSDISEIKKIFESIFKLKLEYESLNTLII